MKHIPTQERKNAFPRLLLYIFYSAPRVGIWSSNISTRGVSQVTIILSSSLYSLKRANLPNSSTYSIPRSNFATVSTSKDANAAKGKASENSRLVIAIILSWCLNTFLSATSFGCCCCSMHCALHSCKVGESILALDSEPFPWFVSPAAWAAAMANMSESWLSLEVPTKSRGWDFMAVLRSCRASWRPFERISW